jgi:glycosyltransferase involved in cell wall biosynthesis
VTLPSACVLIRTYNDEACVLTALDSAWHQDYEGQLAVHIGLDGGSTDETATLVFDYLEAHDGRANFKWYVTPHEHMTLDAATRHLLKLVKTDELFFLDADNVFAPNRVSRHIALDPSPKGLCCCRTYRIGTGHDTEVFPDHWPEKLEPELLLQRTWADTIQLRAKGSYVRERLLPLMEKVPPNDLVDDWLMQLIAAFDSEVCTHQDVLATYVWRPDGLTARTDIRARMNRTAKAFYDILGELASP